MFFWHVICFRNIWSRAFHVLANKIEHLAAHYARFAEEIAEKASKRRCALIISGPCGSELFGRILLPSILRKAIGGTDTPVHLIEWSKGGNQ